MTGCVGGRQAWVNLEAFSWLLHPPRNCEAWPVNYSLLQIPQLTCSEFFLHLLNLVHSSINSKQVILHWNSGPSLGHPFMDPSWAFPLEHPCITTKPACKIDLTLSPDWTAPPHFTTEITKPTFSPMTRLKTSECTFLVAPSPRTSVHQGLSFSSGRGNTSVPPLLCLNPLYSYSASMPAYCSLKIKKAFVTKKKDKTKQKQNTAQNLPKVHLVCRGRPSYLPAGLSSPDSHT